MDPLSSYRDIDRFRAEYNSLLRIAATANPQTKGYEAAGIAVAGVLLISASVPMPAVNRIVQTVAEVWTHFLASATETSTLQVVILDGHVVLEPVADHAKGGVTRRAFLLHTLEDVDPAKLGRASFYTVLDVRYVVMVVQAAMMASENPKDDKRPV